LHPTRPRRITADVPEAVDYRAFPVLVVDDEPDILTSFRLAFRDEFEVICAGGGAEGLAALRDRPIAVAVVDQRMPQMTGTEFLRQSETVRPDMIRIILTGYSDIELVIEAVNNCAIYRYVSKPWDHQELRITLRRAIERYQLERENARLVEELRTANERLADENTYLRARESQSFATDGLVGSSPTMQQALTLVDKVAAASTTVLVLGETGTGKELLARAIHNRSPRKDRLFVAVNCAALTDTLLESELFGHRRGSFTGAVGDKKGLFEVAHGGTLFLDEVGETSAPLQAKLLRVLQEGEIMPVGDTRPRKIDVRVVAATHRDLEAHVRAGTFRQDLYYRLRVFPIRVPPLRERVDDIPALVAHFVAKHADKLGKRVPGVTEDALARLMAFAYPGNVRELENEIERAVLLADPGAAITATELSDVFLGDGETPVEPGGARLRGRADAVQRAEIQAALERHAGRRALAATDLGMTYRGLLKAMHRLGLIADA
jgi:two-component system, NtrC family, response regulator HupR/HoxA